MPGPVARGLVKQTVMTSVYGVTHYGATSQMRRQLQALNLPAETVSLFLVCFLLH